MGWVQPRHGAAVLQGQPWQRPQTRCLCLECPWVGFLLAIVPLCSAGLVAGLVRGQQTI